MAGGVAGLGALACPAVSVRAADDEAVLRILAWPDYFDDAITAPFRDANQCRIEITGIATPEDTMLFLRAGGERFYDIVAPASGLVDALGAAGLLAEIDPAKLTNFAGLFSQMRALPGLATSDKHFGVPLLWGTSALAYDAAIGDPPATWLDLQGPAYVDSLVMPDDGLAHFSIWNWALGADDPMRVSQWMLDNTTRVLIELKQNRAASFGGSAYAAMQSVANGLGQFATVGWQSAPLLPTGAQRALAVVRPAPGGASFCDCISMVAGTQNPDLSMRFIDFMLADETQRNLIDRTKWATVKPSVPPMLRPEVAALYDYGALDNWFAGAPVRGYPPFSDDGSGAATYLDWVLAWDRVRQAKF